ncbi:MAG: nitrate reductase molybdenum cofactor assembly chaperone [Comamonadaceae bacterium]|nr:MAG: nitrate reductase molybdenum cofactor assembly chaperone [Comamonadaceae bacterium]
MALPNSTHSDLAVTLRVLARLLQYPDNEVRAHLREMRGALNGARVVGRGRLAELDALIDGLLAQDALATEADYVQLFDCGRATSLHLFEHVHGDSRDRGPAMIDLAKTFEAAGLFLAEGELPDYLPVVLEYASTQPPAQARAFLAEMAHIFNAIFSALEKRESRYASVLGALIEIAGETARAVTVAPEAPIDESWVEPMAFDGCSTQGQARPGTPQPIRIVRQNPPAQGVSP